MDSIANAVQGFGPRVPGHVQWSPCGPATAESSGHSKAKPSLRQLFGLRLLAVRLSSPTRELIRIFERRECQICNSVEESRIWVQFPPTAPPRLGGPAFGPARQGGRPNADYSLHLAQRASVGSTEAIRSDGRHLEASASTCADRAHLNQRSDPTVGFYPFATPARSARNLTAVGKSHLLTQASRGKVIFFSLGRR